MQIGIIGTGEMGAALSRKWRAAGHEVSLANSRGQEAARILSDRVGARATNVPGAVEGAAVVVLAIPFPAAASLPRGLFDRAAKDVVIVDVSNYFPDIRDPRIPEVDAGLPESLWVSTRIGRPVVKAFNSALSYTLEELGKPAGTPGRLALPVAADDPAARHKIMGLVDEVGFDPVDAGTLDGSWRQQPLTPVYCCDYDIETTRRALAAAIRGKAVGIRDNEWWPAHRTLFAGNPAYADVHGAQIAINRALTGGRSA